MTNPNKSKRREPNVPTVSEKHVKRSPGPFLHLTSPKGGEHWSWVTEQEITWDSNKIFCNVDLILLKFSGEIGYIARDIPISKGTCSWKVGRYLGIGIPPPCADSGGDYHICIRTTDGKYSATNEDPFNIDPRPSIVLTTPKGGTWQPENKLYISWESEYFPPGTTVRVEIIEHILTVLDTFENIPIEQGYFFWDISKTPDVKDVMDYRIQITTMQKFFTSWSDPSEIECISDEPFCVLDWNTKDFPTMYEGTVYYEQFNGFWIRCGGAHGQTDYECYRDYQLGFNDLNVKKLLDDIGYSGIPPVSDEEIWDTIGLLWKWLEGNIEWDEAKLKSIPTLTPGKPTISELAHYYIDNGKLVWSACYSKAMIFANLLIQLGIPQSKFIIAIAHHNIDVEPSDSTHYYPAVYLTGRWFALDPLASQATPNPKKFPDFYHKYSLLPENMVNNIDYLHPFSTNPPPECYMPPGMHFMKVPYIHK